MTFSGKTALVTGGGLGGIEYMIAKGLAPAECSVFIVLRKDAGMAATAERLSSFGTVTSIAVDLGPSEGAPIARDPGGCHCGRPCPSHQHHSIDGLRVLEWESYPYSANKSGLVHMTQHFGKCLAKENISVNVSAPQLFPSKMSNTILDFNDRKRSPRPACHLATVSARPRT